MQKQVYVIEDLNSAMIILEKGHYDLWARCDGRTDQRVYRDGIREKGDQLEVNLGDYDPADGMSGPNVRPGGPWGAYKNEEWVKPRALFLKHYCADCTYPPDLCCFQPGEGDADWDGDEDELYAAIERHGAIPAGAMVSLTDLDGYCGEGGLEAARGKAVPTTEIPNQTPRMWPI